MKPFYFILIFYIGDLQICVQVLNNLCYSIFTWTYIYDSKISVILKNQANGAAHVGINIKCKIMNVQI